MGRVSNIPAETVSAVAKEFCTMAKEQGGMISVRDGASKNLMIKALGEKDAETILGEVDNSSFDNPIIEKLHEIDPKVMAEFTRTEHPQTIALILVHLKPEKAAEVLEHFSPAIQYEITKRMATLKSVPREFIDEVAKTLEKRIDHRQFIRYENGRRAGHCRYIKPDEPLDGKCHYDVSGGFRSRTCLANPQLHVQL